MKVVFRAAIWFLLLVAMVKTPFAICDSMLDLHQQAYAASAGSVNDIFVPGRFRSEALKPDPHTIATSSHRDVATGSGIKFLSSAERRQDISEKAETDRMPAPEPEGLSLKDYVRLVRENNEQISFQDSEWAIRREAVLGAKAIFEPALVGSYQYQNDNHRNTVQELVSQGFIPEFYERSDTYQAAIESLAPTGGRLRVGYSLRDFSNSIDERYGVQRESQTVLGASVTQPLLKGGGIRPTMAGIQVAEADADIAFQTYRQQTTRVLSEAIASYWDLYLAREKHKLRKESEHNAEELLRDNLARVKTGKMAETEVLEAEAGLALRKSIVSEAKQAIVIAMNSVRTFLSFSAAETKADIEPAEQMVLKGVQPDYAESLSKAFKLRAEYIASQKKIKREDIRLVFAKNQMWPQLDLKGSYNMNGLADNWGHSWDDALTQDFETWSVGVELRIPLGGDQKSGSELAATRQRKRQTLLEMKSVEVALANEIDTAIKNVHNSREQAGHYASVADMNRRLLDAEIARFKAGKSNSRILLEREEELNRAREAEIESLVKYQKVLLQLDLAEGSLLVTHGIEMMGGDL